MKKIVCMILSLMLLSIMILPSFANEVETLDKNNNNTTVDQNYTLIGKGSGQNGELTPDDCEDFTKVKVEWAVSDISVVYSAGKVWNQSTMKWEDSKTNYSSTAGTASFTVTNFSTSDVVASVSFAVNNTYSSALKEASFTNNNVSVKTPVSKTDFSKTYTNNDFLALKQTIQATISVIASAFGNMSDTISSAKFGTYTIKIAN